jgi:transposase
MSVEGMGPCLAVRGSTTAMVFEAYVERVLCPTLKSGQQVEVVVVMNLLSAHKGERVRELIEERGCELLCASFSTCRPTHLTSTPSRRLSPRSRA